jgi:hypothetical protein
MFAHGRETVSAQCLGIVVDAGEVRETMNKSSHVCARARGSRLVEEDDSNTLMFGMSLLVLLAATVVSGTPPASMCFSLIGIVVHVGLATVGAFMLRIVACARWPGVPMTQSLAPANGNTSHATVFTTS